MNCFLDEDESYESGEALFREPGDVRDVGAGVRDEDDEEEEARPQTDPEAERQKVPAETPRKEKALKLIKLSKKWKNLLQKTVKTLKENSPRF